jgi:SPP1 gp7 family putative phage head morphogenesis protein
VALDRKGRKAKWAKARVAEADYSSRLRAVARQVGLIIRGLAPSGSVLDVPAVVRALTSYAAVIEPWAAAVAGYMMADVGRRNEAMWRANSKEMAAPLRRELARAPTGAALRGLQAQQVELIKSLPLEAAKRVHGLAQEGLMTSTRASEVAKAILATENVTKARATLIARTEVSRVASNLVQARAEHAGSRGYIWRTSGDLDVRPSHRKMEGEYVPWGSPPTLDGLTGHAGTLPNCRCFVEPIFPAD